MMKSLVLVSAFGLASSFCLLLATSLAEAQVVRSAQGANAAAIQGAVDNFRADLGALNANGVCAGPCAPGVGRREVNWDGVPDNLSSPGVFPDGFFNAIAGDPAAPIRGIQFSSPGSFRTSADSDSDQDGNPGPQAILFEDLAAGNGADFAAFSAQRIFGIVGSNEMDVTFSQPGSPGVSALVKGFGAVFTDVELAGAVRLDYFDINDVLLHSEAAPAFPIDGGDSGKSFSFVGVSFASAVVSRVHITNGGFDLGLTPFPVGGPLIDDAVAMDDFIYGEPLAVPEPGSGLLMLLAAVGLLVRRRQLGACRPTLRVGARSTPATHRC